MLACMPAARPSATTSELLPAPGRGLRAGRPFGAPLSVEELERSFLGAGPDRIAFALAALQHASVARVQLYSAGLTDSAIKHRIAAGVLRRLLHGVYLVGPIEAPLTRHAAALLACGPGAVLSHRTAAALWGLPVSPKTIEITIAGRSGRVRRQGITVHRPAHLNPEDVRTHERLPLTSPAVTLIALAPFVSTRDLARATEEAERRKLITRRELERRLTPNTRGAPKLRAILARYDAPSFTRSEAEARMLDVVRAADLPRPIANARVLRYEADLLWPRERVIVEVDGFAFHGSRATWERDHARDAHLHASGYLVLRFTWLEITREPHTVVARLAAALALRAAP